MVGVRVEGVLGGPRAYAAGAAAADAGRGVEERTVVGFGGVASEAGAVVACDAELGVADAADSSFAWAGLVLGYHGLRAGDFSLFGCEEAFLSYSLQFGVVASRARFPSSRSSCVALGDLLPSLQSNLVQAFHLFFPAVFLFFFALGNFDHDVNASAVAFSAQNLLVLTYGFGVSGQCHDRSYACIPIDHRSCIIFILRCRRCLCALRVDQILRAISRTSVLAPQM